MTKEKKGSALSRLFSIAQKGRGALTLSCISSVVGMLAGVMPYVSVYFIARVLLIPQAGVDTRDTIIFWIIIAGISVVCNMLFTFLGSYGAHKVAFIILYGFRIRVMDHMGKLSIGFFTSNTTGSIQKTMDDNIEKIEGFIAHMLPDLVGSAFVLVGLFGALFSLNIWLALAVVISIIIAMCMQVLMFGGKKTKTLWVDVANATRNVTSAFSEYVQGIAEVKLFGLTGTVTKKLNENIGLYGKWELKQYKKCSTPYVAYKTIIISLLSIVLPVGLILIGRNPGNMEFMLSLLMALIIAPSIYTPLTSCITYGSQLGQLSVGLDDIDKILETQPINSPLNPIESNDYEIKFEDVSFSYQDASDPLRTMALSGVNFCAKSKEMTALVGPSGGGKSTIGQLIARFWDIESGSISIGRVDIKDMSTSHLMDTIAIVFQDTYIFADTVWDNITMKREYTKEQVENATKAAQCHDFIMQLKDGYSTRIGAGGIGLSGGEAQRIAIARAILKDSPIVILDEALAYSDAENENLIQKAIENLIENKTVLVIAHRLQSICNASKIILIDNGEIVEQGSHAELMSQNTLYKELWELQHQADAWAISIDDGAIKTEESEVQI